MADSYAGVRMPLVIHGVAYDGSLVEVQGTRMVTLWPNRPILAPPAAPQHSPTPPRRPDTDRCINWAFGRGAGQPNGDTVA